MPPQFSVNGLPMGMSGSFGAIAVIAALWGFGVMIFWMVCGWRAMRAHERLADATERLARQQANSGNTGTSPIRR